MNFFVEAASVEAEDGVPLYVEGRWVKDAAGRTVVLRGINFETHTWAYQFSNYDPDTGNWSYCGHCGDIPCEPCRPESALDDEVISIARWNITRDDFVRVRSWGANMVRIQVPQYMFDSISNPSYSKEYGYQLFDQWVEWADECGLYVALDMHVPYGGRGYSTGPEGGKTLWRNIHEQTRLRNLWVLLAQRYRNHPRVLFQLMNEPYPERVTGNSHAWWTLAQQLIYDIRSTGASNIIIVSSPLGQNDAFRACTDPLANLMYDVHFYKPYEFTHQQAFWLTPPLPAVSYLNNIEGVALAKKWLAWTDPPNRPNDGNFPGSQVWRDWSETVHAAALDLPLYDKDCMREDLKPFIDFGIDQNVPVMCLEFGVIMNATPDVGHIRWLADLGEIFHEHQIHFAYHSYRGLSDGNTQTSFGIYQCWGCPAGECGTREQCSGAKFEFVIPALAHMFRDPGDINGDQRVDLLDAIQGHQILCGIQPAGIIPGSLVSGADLTGDGKIGIQDVVGVLAEASGLRKNQFLNSEISGVDPQSIPVQTINSTDQASCLLPDQTEGHGYDFTETMPQIDTAKTQIWYKDEDGDQYSDGMWIESVERPWPYYYLASELIATTGDCNDNDPSIYPEAVEICGDGIDQDCDGRDLACAGIESVTLSWTKPDDERVVGYNLYCGKTGTEFKLTPYVTINLTQTTSYTFTGLEAGFEYSFSATSFDAAANESGFSETVNYFVGTASR